MGRGGPRRLPPDAELMAMLAQPGSSVTAIAERYGVSTSAVYQHTARIGMRGRIGRNRLIDQLEARVAGLEEAHELMAQHIRDLQAASRALVPFRPDHRRLADGGTPVRAQRRAARHPEDGIAL